MSKSKSASKIQQQPFFSQHPNIINAVSGGMAGFITGFVVAPAEGMKIFLQATPPPRTYLDPKLLTRLVKMTPPFATKFAGICALEFSVNEKIHHEYGAVAGISASGVTGAIGLTAADHIMFRRLNNAEGAFQAFRNLTKIRPNALWTGFTPMCAREVVFMTSVMYLGPRMGAKLQSVFQGSSTENANEQWRAAGRLTAGMGTTFFSQPFDSLTREMQKQLVKSPTKKPSLLACFQQTSTAALFRGAIPRMGLASVGGTLIGTSFEYFQKKLDPSPTLDADAEFICASTELTK